MTDLLKLDYVRAPKKYNAGLLSLEAGIAFYGTLVVGGMVLVPALAPRSTLSSTCSVVLVSAAATAFIISALAVVVPVAGIIVAGVGLLRRRHCPTAALLALLLHGGILTASVLAHCAGNQEMVDTVTLRWATNTLLDTSPTPRTPARAPKPLVIPHLAKPANHADAGGGQAGAD